MDRVYRVVSAGLWWDAGMLAAALLPWALAVVFLGGV